MIWLVVVLLISSLFYIFLIKPLRHWKCLGVPQDSVGNLLVAAFSTVFSLTSVGESFECIYKKFPDKRYCGGYQFTQHFVLFRDPELIKQITIKDFDYFSDRTNILPENNDLLWQKNLFNLEGQTWRDMRATLSPAFTSRKLKTIYPLMVDSAKRFVSFFKDQNQEMVTVEVRDVFAKYANDVIATTAFGITCDSLQNPTNTFYLMGKEATNFTKLARNMQLIVLIFMPKLGKLLGFKFLQPKIVDYFQKIMKENIKSREENGIIRPDMIQLLLQAKHDRAGAEEAEENDDSFPNNEFSQPIKIKKAQLTDEDIFAQAFFFFFAGFESVSSMMSFMAYELACNPDIQEKLYREIQSDLEKSGSPSPSYENLMKLRYLDMVISETLRKHPSAPAVDRVCIKPYTIQPVEEGEVPIHIKVGESIVFAPIGNQRDPKLFPNPDRFDPERFSDENKANVVSGSYLPFGSGPRHCIGNRFALMEIKTLLYHIISEFEIVAVEKTPIPIKYAKSQVSLALASNAAVGFKKRV